MANSNPTEKILLITDEQVSPEKASLLLRVADILRKTFAITLLRGQDVNETQVLERIQKEPFQLILVPHHRYQAWNRTEGFFGINRNRGPGFAGYFSESMSPSRLPDPSSQMRRILFDLSHLNPAEAAALIRAFTREGDRSGLKPLLAPDTVIYCENWYGNQGQGRRMNQILTLPEITRYEWSKRSAAIRILLLSLWSLIYAEGSGKSETKSSHPQNQPQAYFQLGADSNFLLMRLCYSNSHPLSPKDLLKQFWPHQDTPTQAGQLLLKFSDFVRVHSISDTPHVEMVVGLVPSAPSEKDHDHVHSIWIEPLAPQLIKENPYEAPGPQNPQLRALPNVSLSQSSPRLLNNPAEGQDLSQSNAIKDLGARIKELNQKVETQNQTIQEMRSGGIGSAPPLPPPDVEGLLEAFQERYSEARFQIRQFELQMIEIQKKGTTPQEAETLRLKMEALMNRERAWIKKIMQTMEMYKKDLRKPKKK